MLLRDKQFCSTHQSKLLLLFAFIVGEPIWAEIVTETR